MGIEVYRLLYVSSDSPNRAEGPTFASTRHDFGASDNFSSRRIGLPSITHDTDNDLSFAFLRSTCRRYDPSHPAPS